MTNRLTKPPKAVYVAAVPAVYGRAAYSYVRYEYVQFDSNGRPLPFYPDPVYGNFVGVTSAPSRFNTPRRAVTYSVPAIIARAATPARVDYLGQAGWGAGAVSIKKVPLFGAFSGSIPRSVVATQFGLTDPRFNYTYGHMSHSLVIRADTWSVVERGVTVLSGAKTSGPIEVELVRRSSVVTYTVDGVDVYQSATPVAGDTYGAAMLFSLGDYVDAPEVRQLTQASELRLVVPAFRIAAGAAAFGDLRLPMWGISMTLSAWAGTNELSLVVPAPLLALGTRPYNFARLVAPAFSTRGVAGPPEQLPTSLLLFHPAPLLSATLLGGYSMALPLVVPAPLLIGADLGRLGFAKLQLPGLVRFNAYAPYMPPGQIDGTDSVVAGDTATLETAMVLLALDSLEASSISASLVIVLELAAMDGLSVAEGFSLGSIVELLAMERVAINGVAASTQREAIQYAVNAATGALSVYSGFDFLGFASIRGETYGYKRDGVYRIGEPNGELIDALIEFGTTDYDTAANKRIEQVYLGVRTDGACFVRVQVDRGRDRVYRVRGGDDTVQRATLAKGVSGRYWSLTLEITDASFAEVDSLEVLVGATKRRGFGARN